MNRLLNGKNRTYTSISLLGKSLRLDIKYRENPIAEINKKENKIELILPKKYKTIKDKTIINMAIEKMYDEVSKKEIANSMEEVRIIMGYAPEDYRIKRMKDTFVKINNKKEITINPDIVRFNKKIIETTLIQYFCKLKYEDNSIAYKEELIRGLEKYESTRFSLLKTHKSLKYVS